MDRETQTSSSDATHALWTRFIPYSWSNGQTLKQDSRGWRCLVSTRDRKIQGGAPPARSGYRQKDQDTDTRTRTDRSLDDTMRPALETPPRDGEPDGNVRGTHASTDGNLTVLY